MRQEPECCLDLRIPVVPGVVILNRDGGGILWSKCRLSELTYPSADGLTLSSILLVWVAKNRMVFSLSSGARVEEHPVPLSFAVLVW